MGRAKRYKISLTKDEAIQLLGRTSPSGTYLLGSLEQREQLKVKRQELRDKYRYEIYCKENGIKQEDVSVYWDKSKDFSIMVKPNLPTDFCVFTKVKDLIDSYVPSEIEILPNIVNNNYIYQLAFTDVHLGMDSDDSNYGLYKSQWNRNSVLERVKLMAQTFIKETPYEIDCIQVLNMGDFADGLDGYTTRRDHKLPQNMTNEEVHDLGVEFMTHIAETILQNKKCNKIIFYNVCNSNHSSAFDYFIMQAFKGRFMNNPRIEIINELKFIGHIEYGGHVEILCHGKDSKNMKFGIKPHLEVKSVDRIKEYIEHYDLKGFIHFHKGDSHRYAKDKDNIFDFTNYLALSPSSSWVQHNFQKGRSGFTINKRIKGQYSGISGQDYEFKWNSNELK